MQNNSTANTLAFTFTLANLNGNREPFYGTHISTDQLIQNVLENYLSNTFVAKMNLQVWIIRLILKNIELHSMINSEDDNIS